MLKELEKKFEIAELGWKKWNLLLDKLVIGEKYCIIYYEIDKQEYIEKTRKWIPDFLCRKGFKDVIVFSDVSLFENRNDERIKDINIYEYELHEGEEILQLYKLCRFVQFFYIFSLNSPFGNDNMVGHKGIIFEDYLRSRG